MLYRRTVGIKSRKYDEMEVSFENFRDSITLCYFFTFFSFSLFYAGLPIFANIILKWSASDLGIFLAYSSLIMVIVQGPILSLLANKFSNYTLVLIGSFLLGISFIILSYEEIVLLYLANTLLAVGNGLMWPSFLSILSSTGSREKQGLIQGYGTSMGSIASMMGLIIGGILFETIGTFVFILGAFVFFIITVLMLIHRLRHQKKPFIYPISKL